MAAQEADDRERTAALLASVRASIQAERAAREEATAEPPAGLAELLRPPGTPRHGSRPLSSVTRQLTERLILLFSRVVSHYV